MGPSQKKKLHIFSKSKLAEKAYIPPSRKGGVTELSFRDLERIGLELSSRGRDRLRRGSSVALASAPVKIGKRESQS